MKNKLVTLLIMLVLAFAANAQQPTFSVALDSVSFKLIQNGTETRFDTTSVSQSLKEKEATATVLKTEADYIERLLYLRRSIAVLNEEKTVLSEILKKAKQCVLSK
jgi:hypothetical protein